jgi:hypothetical protein
VFHGYFLCPQNYCHYPCLSIRPWPVAYAQIWPIGTFLVTLTIPRPLAAG